MTTRRGPQPKRELMLARAVQYVSILPIEARPTMDEIAGHHNVTKRQLQLAYAKHRERVQRECVDQIADELIERFDAYDAMTPEEQEQRDRKIDALIEYEQSLSLTRKILKRKRSKKPRSS